MCIPPGVSLGPGWEGPQSLSGAGLEAGRPRNWSSEMAAGFEAPREWTTEMGSATRTPCDHMSMMVTEGSGCWLPARPDMVAPKCLWEPPQPLSFLPSLFPPSPSVLPFPLLAQSPWFPLAKSHRLNFLIYFPREVSSWAHPLPQPGLPSDLPQGSLSPYSLCLPFPPPTHLL